MSETTYYQRKRETILNRAKDYYENNKEVLREITKKNKYKGLSEKKKNIKRQCGRNRYNMPEEEKQTLKDYQKSKKVIVKLKKYDFW